MSIPVTPLCNLSIINCFCWAGMQASKAFYTLMLPYRKPFGAPYIVYRAYTFAYAAGCTCFAITYKSFIYLLPTIFPLLMILLTEALQDLPRTMILFIFEAMTNPAELSFCKPSPDSYTPISCCISIWKIVRYQAHVPTGINMQVFHCKYGFCIHEWPTPIRNSTGSYGENILCVIDGNPFHELLHLQR